MSAIDPHVPLEVLVLAQRHPEHCHGLFGVADRGQLIPNVAATQVRDEFARAVAEQRSALLKLEHAERELQAAAHRAVNAGAEVTQIAGLAEVARGTVYAWLRAAEQRHG